jgi:transposase
VVHAYEQGQGSQRQLAHRFDVSLSFIQSLLQRYRRTGSVKPKPHGGGNPGEIGPHVALVQHLPPQQPDASLAARCEQLAAAVQVRVGRTTMHRVLGQLGLSREKRRSAPPNTILLRVATRGQRPTKPSARSRQSS